MTFLLPLLLLLAQLPSEPSPGVALGSGLCCSLPSPTLWESQGPGWGVHKKVPMQDWVVFP